MSKGIQKLFVLLIVIAAAGGLLVWLTKHRAVTELPQTRPQQALTKPGPPQAATDSLVERLSACARDLTSAGDAAVRHQKLQSLRDSLASGSTNDISVAIRRFLDSKTDSSTGLGFKPGAKGSLKEAPTLRTYLLDYLGQIDRLAAAAYAKTILASSDSPDEWAIALRDLAMADASPESRKLLEDKTRELLRREDWQQNPSSGYLEAFDTAVYLGGTNLMPDLATLVRKKDNRAVAFAAYLTLDRLVTADPPATLGAMQADPDLLQGREITRADFFARADLRDPQQRRVIENYLLDSRIAAPELQQFAGIFPNGGHMVSENLLTPMPTPQPGDLAAHDAACLKVVNEWLADPRFEKIRPELNKLKTRLEEFTRQAAR